MKTITVVDLQAADEIKHAWISKGWTIISLVDPELQRKKIGKTHWVFSFHDIWSQSPIKIRPEAKDIWDIVGRVKEETSGQILVHCHAGISRSTAVAIGLEILLNRKTFQEAFDSVSAQRNKNIWPNQLIIKHFEALCPKECKGLFEFLKRWRGNQIATCS